MLLKLWKGGLLKNRPIPQDHFARILRHSDPDERDLWVLASETGFRIGDLLKIRQWQVPKCNTGLPMAADRQGLTEPCRLTLTEEKTGKLREVELTGKAITALQRSLNNCPTRHPFKYLFPSRLRSGAVDRDGERKGNSHLHRSTAHRHFARCVRAAGLSDQGYTVHSLRKVYAQRLYAETRSALAVQRDLGHASLQTTLLYIFDLEL